MVADSIFHLNEKATFLIGTMNYQSAAELLQEGIDTLENDYNMETNDHGDDLTVERHNKTNQCEVMMDEGSQQHEQGALNRYDHYRHHPQHVVVAVEPSLEANADHDDVISFFFIYRRTMKLALTERYLNNADLSYLTHHNVNLLSAVLFYNYGLCLHIQGQASGCETKLEDASLAYEMALSVLGLVESNDGDESFAAAQQPSTVLLLELALLNNLGHIHLFFSITKQAHLCLRRMHFILFGATQGWTLRIPQDLSCFAHNVLFNASQHTRPAPAA